MLCKRQFLATSAVLACILCDLTTLSARADDRGTCEKKSDHELDTAIAACSRLIKSGKLSGEALALIYFNRGSRYGTEYYRGNIYGSKGDLDRAIADLSAAIRLEPDSAEFRSYRGLAYAMKGDLDRAIADYDEAIRLDPMGVGLFDDRGRVYVKKGDLVRAIGDFEEALRLDPHDVDASGDLAGARARAEKPAR
jgi:tetratricopeptide (TPR) repeat protein